MLHHGVEAKAKHDHQGNASKFTHTPNEHHCQEKADEDKTRETFKGPTERTGEMLICTLEPRDQIKDN